MNVFDLFAKISLDSSGYENSLQNQTSKLGDDALHFEKLQASHFVRRSLPKLARVPPLEPLI